MPRKAVDDSQLRRKEQCSMGDDQTSQRTSRSDTTALVRHLPAAILVIILVAFAVDNRHKVTVGFVFTNSRVPLVFVLVATAVLGAAVGALLRRRRT